jgi:tetratricopeptide (TPR) repeat protein
MDKMPARYQTHLIAISLALVTFAVFGQVLHSGFVYFDDPEYVTENSHIQNVPVLQTIKWAFTTGCAANWHPLTWLSHTLDCKLFGLNPAGHHLTNLLLHIANTLLLFAVLKAMTGALWRSAFAAALFALHPLHVESVAWVSERKDILSTLFWFLTMAAYVHYTRNPNARSYLLTLVLFALGLMAKPMLVTLPFVLLLLDYWPLNRLENNNRGQIYPPYSWRIYRLVYEKIPFFVLSAVSSVITCLVQQHAMTNIEVFPLKWRIANAVVSYARYIEKMFLPRKLAVLYPLAGNLPKVWVVAAAVIFLLVISILVIRLSPRRKYLLIGWLWFVGTLVPVIGLVQVGMQAMADRYAYVPLTGLFIVVSWGVADITTTWRRRKILLTIAAIIVLLALSICTNLQLRYWHNTMSLFGRAAAVTNYNYTAYNNLGYTFVEQKKFEQAISYYKKAISIKPDYAEACSNLGAAYGELGRYDEAIEVLQRSLRLKPNYAKAYYNLGIVYSSSGRWQQAIEAYGNSLKIDPSNAEAYNKLGAACANLQLSEQAVEAYQKALQINPSLATVRNNLAVLLLEQNKIDEAIGHLHQAVQTEPNYADAYNNLGIAFGKLGRSQEEIEAYRQAVKIKQDYADALYNLGVSYSNLRRYAEAIEVFKQTVKVNPDDAWAHFGLGSAYLKVGESDSAMKEYEILKHLDAEKANRLFDSIQNTPPNHE